MVFVKIAGSILALLLALNSLHNCLVHARQGRRMSENNRRIIAYIHREDVVGGRKMVDDKVWSSYKDGENGNKDGSEGREPPISSPSSGATRGHDRAAAGKDQNSSKESLEEPENLLNKQENGKSVETKESEPIQKSRLDEHYKTGVREVETGMVMQLMFKDYRGMRKPRRNTPINNNQPRG